MRPLHIIALATVTLMAGGCGLLEPDPPWVERQEALDTNRQLWESAAVESYRYSFTRHCFCGFVGTFTVTVTDGVVTAAVSEQDGESVPEAALPELSTIEGLFDEAQRGIDVKAHGFEAEYHPELGYPTLVDLDPIENAIDDEVTYRAESLVSLDGG